ncbi:2-hydroxyacid dehydrogenase [Marinobacteraceae bacterium S3BR75-40.1]
MEQAAHRWRVAVFDTHRYEQPTLEEANSDGTLELTYHEAHLSLKTASLAHGHDAVCCFVNDHLDSETLTALKAEGVRLVALRCAGFNNVDLKAARRLELPVVRVPAYSPYAVAEHAMALVLSLNRKIHKAYNRVRELNFSLEGLTGFDLHGKTFGIVGTGEIGEKMARIAHGFGCRVIAHSKHKSPALEKEGWLTYCDFDTLLESSDIVSLHVPLTPDTHHMINDAAFSCMKRGAMLINTGRGALIDASALIRALKNGHIGAAGLDVYEEEEDIFFQDLSDRILQDDTLARLLTFPNVLITAHQAFLTQEALQNIARTTVDNIRAYLGQGLLRNVVQAEAVMR